MMRKQTPALLLALMLFTALLAPQALASGTAGFVNIAAAPKNALYTPLEIPGYAHTVYAFTGADGKTQFRVYGQTSTETGFFPVTVTAGAGYQPGGAMTVSLDPALTPVTDTQQAAATATLSASAVPPPPGFFSAGSPGIIYMENLFGQRETLAHASYDGQNLVFVPALNNLPVPGALAVVVEDMSARIKAMGAQNYSLPFDLREGFKTQVNILTSDGVPATASTAYPAIDKASLVQFGAQPSTQPAAAQPAAQATPRPVAPPVSAATRRPTSARRSPKPTADPNATAKPKTIKYGAKGPEVTALQKRLAALGYSVGKVDGIFGKATEKALIAFQKNNKLKADGLGGAATLKSLYSGAAIGANLQPDAIKNPLSLSASPDKSEVFVGDTITWKVAVSGWGSGSNKFVDMNVSLNGVAYKNGKTDKAESGSLSFIPNTPGRYTLSATAGSSSYAKDGKNYYDSGAISGAAAVVVKARPQGVITQETLKVVVDIPIETQKKDNPDLPKGSEKVVQDGVVGEKIVTYIITKADGKEVAREKTGEETVAKPMVPRIIEVGTKGDTPAPVVTTETVTETKAIPFTTQIKEDPAMDKGTEKVIQEGIDGEKTITHVITKTDGKETDRKTTEEVTKAMVPKLVSVGTKPVITEETTTKTEPIPFTTVRRDNPEMEKGKEKVVVTGVDGVKTITTTTIKTDGEVTSTTTTEEITTAPVTQIVDVGTKEAPQPEEPQPEQPKDETPPAEQPKDETPPAEQPKDEIPPAEQPKDETPPAEQPKDETAPAAP